MTQTVVDLPMVSAVLHQWQRVDRAKVGGCGVSWA